MKKVVRQPLSDKTQAHLREQQAAVDAEPTAKERKRLAVKLWDTKTKRNVGKAAFSEVVEVLKEMCNFDDLCMYCEQHPGGHVEHVKPKGKHPDLAFYWHNFLWACWTCNSKYKGERDHDAFMDPSTAGFDVWARWRFDVLTGYYRAIHEEDIGARETLRILGFDVRASLASARKRHFRRIIRDIKQYGIDRTLGRHEKARLIAKDLCERFPALVEWVLLRDELSKEVPIELRSELEKVRKVKERFPEIVEDAGL